MKLNKKFDWTKALVLFFGTVLSIGLAVVLYATKELLGVQIGRPIITVVSLHAMPALIYTFRYIRNQDHWKRNSVFLGLFLVAQGVMALGTFGFRFFVSGESTITAFNHAMMGLLFVKLTLLGIVILPPALNVIEKIVGSFIAIGLVVLYIFQCLATVIVVIALTPVVTAAIFNSLARFLGVKISLPFAIND